MNNTIDNLMFGIMDNNMGFHKERSYVRPQMVHPEIKTDGSMFDFVYTSIYSLLNRSLFVFIFGLMSTLSNFINSFFAMFFSVSSNNSSFLDTSYFATHFSHFIQLFTNLIRNVFDTLFYSIVN